MDTGIIPNGLLMTQKKIRETGNLEERKRSKKSQKAMGTTQTRTGNERSNKGSEKGNTE
jgi:hypothetical protein